ncbi:MAG: alpha/beta fold hydrolase, partial [Silvibacterium sp.]|nr:alpha/beta fold hydrolase [Silvibacterium sp.]
MMMAPWAAKAASFDVLAYNPPGHGSDRRPPLRSIDHVVHSCAEELRTLRKPLVCLGYSMGGILAFAIARELELLGLMPAGVIISHTLPPHRWPDNLRLIHGELETIFAPEFDRTGVDPQLRQEFLSIVSADFEIAASYQVWGEDKIQCPVYLLAGEKDVLAAPSIV